MVTEHTYDDKTTEGDDKYVTKTSTKHNSHGVTSISISTDSVQPSGQRRGLRRVIEKQTDFGLLQSEAA